jgi:YVTN family beta-propeller protein
MKSKIILSMVVIALVCFGQFETHSQTNSRKAKTNDSLSVSLDVTTRSGLIYISHIALDYVSVLDPESNKIIGKIKSGNGSCCVELSTNYGYIANYKSNDVTVFDKRTGNTIATVPAGEHPSHLVLTTDSRYLLIGHESNDGLWFLDARTNQITKKVSEGTGILCKQDNGKKIYQSQIFIPYIFVIDPETQMIVKRINVGGRPLDLAVTPDQKYLYIANYDLNELETIDTKTDSVVARIPHMNNARGIAITPDGRFAYVTNVTSSTVTVVDLGSASTVKVIPVGTMPTSVAFLKDGKYAYVSCQGNASIFVINAQTQEIVQSIAVGSNPIKVQVK